MDRRAALKKLGAGGALAAGGAVIVSQPAFAFAAPVVTGSPTIVVRTTGIRSAEIGISDVPAGSCPASATSSTGPELISLDWRTFYPDGNTVMSSGSGTTVTIPAGFQQWFPDDRIFVSVVYRYCCVYPGDTTCICVQWIREFANTGGFGSAAVWTIVPASSSGPTQVPCPSGLAAPFAAPFSTSTTVIGRDAEGNLILAGEPLPAAPSDEAADSSGDSTSGGDDTDPIDSSSIESDPEDADG